jgi:aminoglycoside phosphotransferase family enzyme/predicted kinase
VPAAVLETHISYVFLFGDRAVKLKKPVQFPFLDLSTPELREAACRREVDLNRRLAPDVYLGVGNVTGTDGTVCDHLVLMRRMPDDRRLSHLVADGAVDGGALVPLARTIAAFHARAERSPAIALAGRPRTLRERWEAGFREIAPLLDDGDERACEGEIEHLVRRYLDGRARLFDSRVEAGSIVDGHGDLLADDIFLLDDGPRVLDCLEFDDALRFGDVLADVAFLVMDLERLGAPQLARSFLDAYRELSGEQHPRTLEDHYVAFRAHIRAKVALLRDDARSREHARRLLELAVSHLRQGRVTLTLVGGGPATGKSTLAAGIGERLGSSVLRSDEIRKDLAGRGHAEHEETAVGHGIYDRAHTDATYAELLRRAGVLLRLGYPVVLDATWRSDEHRRAAAALAHETASDLVELRCEVPLAVAEQRAADRARSGIDPSDASGAVVRAVAERFEPWPGATVITTVGEPEAALAAGLAAIGDPRRPATGEDPELGAPSAPPRSGRRRSG